jgi:hypothetical protein
MAKPALRIIDGHLNTHRAAVALSITAPDVESSSIRAIVKCAV